MSGPTRQRSLRERLHGISIPWQGRKSKTFHSKEEQALAESETKPGSLDSRSCDPIPSSGDEKGITTSTNGGTAAKETVSKLSSSPPPTQSSDTSTKSEDKSSTTKDQTEKKLLHRSFTQPKGTEEYQVRASDTLASVAARFDTTPSELAKLNKLTARMIFPGQLLFVPEKKTLTKDPDSQSETGENSTLIQDNGDEDSTTSQGNNKLGVLEDNSLIPKRKVSVTDALRIPYRRHSDRMQRFLKVKARHFTDGQGVVAGVLIITPNAVMFDPDVSDPLVIEHGIESYGVIAPLDMVMRTAIYFDITHMKVKNAPEAPLNIPKPDIYYGKMIVTSNEDSTNNSSQTREVNNRSANGDVSGSAAQNSGTDRQTQKSDDDQDGDAKKEKDDSKTKMPQFSKSTDALATTSSDQGPNQAEEHKKERLSREGSLDKEVTEAFANLEASQKIAPATPNNSVDSPTPPLSASSIPEDRPIPESRRERMLKRLSYPMESITSYTQSSLSRILSSSPKSLVDGLFVKASEDDKNKDELQEEGKDETAAEGDERLESAEKEAQEHEAKSTPEKRLSASLPNPPTAQISTEEENTQISKSETASVGYKNLVEERPEMFELLDKLLRQNAVKEQEGTPLYLCLRMGHPKKKHTQMTPILSYGKKKAKSEYWFSIPYNRVEDMYNFLQQWFPHLYGDVDEKNPEELGFDPIDDSVEDEKEEEGEEKVEEGNEEKRSTPMSFLKLVEDHFGFRSISPTDWEVLSMGESEQISFADLELPVPELRNSSEILEEDHVKELHILLPARVVGYDWIKLFSTAENGYHLKTLYRLVSEYDAPVILVIKDIEGAVFGAILSTSLRPSNSFYGSDESVLFTFHPEFKVFKSTGSNTYYIKGNLNWFAIGSGEGTFGLWIDGDLNHGRCQKCLTFDNDVLSKSSDFIVTSLEIWGFV